MRMLRRSMPARAAMRESEVYAHCYGERGGEILTVTKLERPPPPPRVTGEALRRALEKRIDGRRLQ
ncbi:MAG: hypothetical protein ACYDCH_13090 [Gaiellaceae bacterium]